MHAGDLCKSDDLQKIKDLTLADLKVMGIVGKVRFVSNCCGMVINFDNGLLLIKTSNLFVTQNPPSFTDFF